MLASPSSTLRLIIAVAVLFIIPFISEGQAVFINEIHYDNDGSDANEGVEIAGASGTDLAGWTAIPYNGSNGTFYSSTSLSGTIPDEGCGVGAIWFPISGLQNGAPDGIALVNDVGLVIQFLSYEGILTATNGPASGQTSIDIGFSEPGNTPNGFSLQLIGSGSNYVDFSWSAPSAHSRGILNTSQSISPCGSSCSISGSGLASVTCNDNTTSSDGTDDFISFTLNPSGSNIDTDYSVSVSSGTISPTSASYGSATTFTLQLGSAGSGDVDVTITDAGDNSCTLIASITDPGICSAGVLPVCIVSQDFDGTTPEWSFSTDVAFFDNNADGFFGIHDANGMANDGNPNDTGDGNAFDVAQITLPEISGDFLFVNDLDDEGNGTTGDATISFNSISVAGYTSTELSFDYDVVGFDTGDDVFYQVFIDGIGQGSVHLANGGSSTSTISGTEVISIPNGSLNVSFDLIINQNADNDQAGFDNFRICGIAPSGCTPNHNITSFLPTSGPAGTLVTITGSGFNGATAASYSGAASPAIEVVDDNTIIAEVPNNATSGAIGVTVSSCEALSANSFTVLTDNGTCGASGGGGSFASAPFISEVYDGSSGSLSYIEIFNGTNTSVNLSAGNYEIEIETGSTSTYALSGTLASGDTYIIQLGFSTSSCSNFSPDLDLSTAPGFNGDDQIYLLENSVILDYAPNPNHPDAGGTGTSQPGFSQSRNSSVTSPSATYNASEWTIGTTENCDDLGFPPFVPAGSEITVNNQPLDVDCAALTFSVGATATPGFESGSGAYTWRYNEPGTDTWEAISTLNAMSDFTVVGAGTNTITITGSTANLLDYQFYVDMGTAGSPQCRVYSNAAQYTYESRAFYRSNGNGDWTNSATWQMSDTEGGTYVAACQYPLDRNSEKVIIRSGNSVSFDNVDVSADELEIETGATLTIETSGGLTVNNGNSSGADLVVVGTLEDKAVSPNGITFNTDATWQLDPNGTIVKTNTSSVSRYRDFYEGGIISIPTTANWIYRREGSNEVSVVSTNMFYPNLTFENFGGSTYDPSDAQRFFQGSLSAPVIYGDLDIGGAGSSGYVVRTNNTNTSPILVEGELIIRSGSTLTNDDNGGSSDGTGIEVQGDLTIEGSLDFTASTVAGRGQVVFSGSGDQLGIGDGNAISVNEFEINKTTGDFLTEFSLNVNREARFIAGIYEIDDLASNPADVEFSTSAVASSMSNASFVDGNVVKFGNADFTFPIGDTRADGISLYQPSRIFDITGFGGGFTARYFAEAHPNAGAYYDGESNNPNDYQEISNCDYWNVERISGNTENAKIGLTYTNPNNSDGDPANDNCNSIDDVTSVFITRWNPFASDWEQPISEGSATGPVEATSELLNPSLGGYGDFTLTSNNPNFNILPITLLSFQAKAENGLVNTNWTTATEINNDYFTIERSKDGNLWEKVGTVDGAGDSRSELSYSLVDNRPYSGISYYRLRQTDYDGATTLSEPRAVEIRQDGTFGIDNVYRGKEGLNLVYHATNPYVLVEIYDLLGKRIHGELSENSGNGFGTIYPDLAKGAYLLRLSHGSEFDSEKFVW